MCKTNNISWLICIQMHSCSSVRMLLPSSLHADVANGKRISMMRGELRSRPPKVLALQNPDIPAIKTIAKERRKQEASKMADRASRLAARRNLRAEAAWRTHASSPRHGDTQAFLSIKGPAPPTGTRRAESCFWCGIGSGLMIGCSSCQRCFCYQCYELRDEMGLRAWSKDIKNPDFRCVVCRGVEEDEESSPTSKQMKLRNTGSAKPKPKSSRAHNGQPRSASGQFLSYTSKVSNGKNSRKSRSNLRETSYSQLGTEESSSDPSTSTFHVSDDDE